MANRREIKKSIKSSTNSIIEDGFMEAINGDSKERDKMDKLIDEVVDYRLELLSKVSNYPRHSKRSEKKKHFKDIKGQLQKYNTDYSKKIGRVS